MQLCDMIQQSIMISDNKSNTRKIIFSFFINWHWWKKKIISHLSVIYCTILPFQETKPRNYHSHTLLSALRKRIITHQPLARARHDKKKKRAFQLSSRRTRLRYRESIFASINKYGIAERQLNAKSSSTTWENSSMTIVWTESESNISGKQQKKSYNTIFPGTDAIASRGEPRNSERTSLPTLRLFTLRVSLFRRAFRAGEAIACLSLLCSLAREHARDLRAYIQSTYRGELGILPIPIPARLSEHRQIR